jgi:hypothetical protein
MIDDIGEGLSFMGNSDDAWLDDAACADLPVESFFVQAGHVIDEEVLNVCRECPVRLRLSITGGYFGGMSPGQRREKSLKEAEEFIKTDIVQGIMREQEGPDAETIVYS